MLFCLVSVGRFPQPPYGWRICQDIDEQTPGWPHQQHQSATDRRTHENAKVATRRIQTHGTLQIVTANDVMNQQLGSRMPQHTRHAMNGQQQHRLPDLDTVGKKQYRPAQ